jgi:hypothetical protein
MTKNNEFYKCVDCDFHSKSKVMKKIHELKSNHTVVVMGFLKDLFA